MLVAALLDLLEVPLELVDLLRDRRAVDLVYLVAVAADDGHLAVVEVDHVAGELDERAGVAPDEVLALADAEQERAPVARHDELVRVVLRDGDDPVGPDDLRQRLPDGLGETQGSASFCTSSMKCARTSVSVSLSNV